MRYKKRLRTSRLLLRRWRAKDKYDLHEYAKLDTVGPSAGWAPHKDLAESARIIRQFLASPGTYAIVYKASGKVIGSIGFHFTSVCRDVPDERSVEIGYVLSPDYWGQGFVPEAVRACLRHAFEDLRMDAVWCGCFDTNERSRRVIEKCGFVYGYDKAAKLEPLGGIEVIEKIYKMTRERFLELYPR